MMKVTAFVRRFATSAARLEEAVSATVEKEAVSATVEKDGRSRMQKIGKICCNCRCIQT